MAEKKPLSRSGATFVDIGASDTIPAANVPAINLAGTGPGGVVNKLPLGSIAQGGATDGQSMLWNTGSGTWAPGTPAGGGDVSDGDTLTTGLTFPNTGLHILDTDDSHDLILSPGSNLSADRTLTLTTGDANRTLNISAADVTISSFGATLVDDASAAAARLTLGLVIGTDVQAQDPELAAIAGLTSAADKGIQFTGSGTAATYDLTAAGKALLDDADAAAQRTTLGVDAAGDVLLTAAPGTDLTASGMKIVLTANETQAFGDVCRVGSDGKATIANASAFSTSSGLFMCLQSATADSTATYLSLGVARNDAWAWTVSGHVYLSVAGTTGNTLTQTPPSTAGQVVQVLGVATHADRIFFRPELLQIEVA